MLTKEFVTAGRAVFTVSGPDARFTFKIKFKKGTNGFKDAYFVSLLTGPNNTEDFTYLGMLDAENGMVRLTDKSRHNDDSRPVKAIRWAVKTIWSNLQIPDGYRIQHEGRCGRCGRALTVPESIDSGIGPECIKRMGR